MDFTCGLYYRWQKIRKSWIVSVIISVFIILTLISVIILHFANYYYENNTLLYLLKDSESQQIDYFDAIYFSAITFYTIGYGDIIPRAQDYKWIIITECTLGLLTNSLLIGVIIYKCLKRPMNITICRKLLIKQEKNTFYITPRIINLGRDTINVEVFMELLYFKLDQETNSRTRTRITRSKTLIIMSKSYTPSFEIEKEHWRRLAANYTVKDLGIRITITANDIRNADTIVSTKDFYKSDFRFGKEYKSIYNWINIYKSKKISYKQIEKIIEDKGIKEEYEKVISKTKKSMQLTD